MNRCLVLFLLGEKGYVSLKSLVASESSNLEMVQLVVIGRDNGVNNDYAEAIMIECQSHSVPYTFDYKSGYLSLPNSVTHGLAIGWRWKLDLKDVKLIVLHDSLLPKYRGFNPLVTALIQGDKEIGVTAFQADSGIDTGGIIAQEGVDVSYPIKIKDAIKIVSEVYGRLIVKVCEQIRTSIISAQAQNNDLSTFSLWRDDEDYRVDWNNDAIWIKRFIDSVGDPYKGALTTYKGRRIRIVESAVCEDVSIVNRAPGKLFLISGSSAIVVCKSRLLKIIEARYDETGSLVFFDRLRERLT